MLRHYNPVAFRSRVIKCEQVDADETLLRTVLGPVSRVKRQHEGAAVLIDRIAVHNFVALEVSGS